MKQCQISDNVLKYSRATYGVLLFLAFLLKSQWLVLATGILIILGAVSLKLNASYVFFDFLLNKLLHQNSEPRSRDQAEISFVGGATGLLILTGFLLLYFNISPNFAWIYLLIVDFMIFLACFVGFCVATMMYIFFKKIFIKPPPPSV